MFLALPRWEELYPLFSRELLAGVLHNEIAKSVILLVN